MRPGPRRNAGQPRLTRRQQSNGIPEHMLTEGMQSPFNNNPSNLNGEVGKRGTSAAGHRSKDSKATSLSPTETETRKMMREKEASQE